MGFIKQAAAVSLAALFSPIAAAAQAYEPQLYPPVESERSYILHACTADKALLEVRFDLSVSPHFETTQLGAPESDRSRAFQSEVNSYFYGALQDEWQKTVGEMTLPQIMNGEQNALRPLLNGLYGYLDPRFNEDKEFRNINYVLPVLKGGQYAAQHPICL